MKQTFEELLKGKRKLPNANGNYYSEITVIELLKLVRQKTLEEAANNADADYNITESFDRMTGENIEVYVLKESILQLDKDSIEV